jgi:acetoin utilization deacetylase AcuC-like enzyme
MRKVPLSAQTPTNAPYPPSSANVKLTADGPERSTPEKQAFFAVTLLYHSSQFLEHDTGAHPESSARLLHIQKRLEESGLAALCPTPPWQPVREAELLAVHDQGYLAELESIVARGGGMLDSDTVVSSRSLDVARLAAGAACDAVRQVVSGMDSTALCLLRPPGHHAMRRRAMGFCLFGNVALAARCALDQCGLDRVLIVDWDVHHGNGTQDMFYNDERVGFFSSHRWPFYPGTGAADETGAAAGLGFTRNLPLEFGTSRRECLTQFADELTSFAARIKPQLVLVSAGFDAHRTDPIGSLGWETEDYAALTELIEQVAADYSGRRIVSVLEGGYNPPVLAECVETHLRGLMKHP